MLNKYLSNEWMMNLTTLGVGYVVPLRFSLWFYLLAVFHWGRAGGAAEDREGATQAWFQIPALLIHVTFAQSVFR